MPIYRKQISEFIVAAVPVSFKSGIRRKAAITVYLKIQVTGKVIQIELHESADRLLLLLGNQFDSKLH
ncbi:hypothetical protein D3C75_1290200 [compost metagenome]